MSFLPPKKLFQNWYLGASTNGESRKSALPEPVKRPDSQIRGLKPWNHSFFRHPPDQRLAIGALDQQLWCWGRDIQNPQGNRLLRIGFHRSRTEGQSSCYHARSFDGGLVALWGFGVLYSFAPFGSVFLGRYQFAPVHHPESEGIFDPEGTFLQRFQPARDLVVAQSLRQLIGRLCQWIARYEHEVLETEGISYRVACLQAKPGKIAVPPGDLPGHWEFLAKKSKDQKPCHLTGGKWGRLLEPVKRSASTPKLGQPVPVSQFLGMRPGHRPAFQRMPTR